MSTRDMILDVMNDVDPAFIKEHMDRATTTGFRKFIRFAAPAMIYAAACIAAILILPHIIGKTPDKPPVDTSVIPGVTETYETTEPDDTAVPETTEQESVSIETEESSAVPEESLPENIDPPETNEVYETKPVVTTPPITETTPSTTPPAPITKPDPKPEPEPEPIPEPDGMIHVTDGDIPYSYVLYDYTYHLSDYARSIMAADPVFTDAESFRSFIDEIYDPDSYFDGSLNHLFEESGYFDDEFFKTHNLYWNQVSEASGSISVSINSITKSNGGIHITLDRYLPMLRTHDMQTNTFLVAVDKTLVQNTNVSYRYDTYSEYYNSDGDTYYYKKAKGIHGVTTYILNEIPEDTDNFFKQTVIMRTTDDMDKFLKNISAVCDGNTDKYFRELPQSYKSTYEIYDLVYLGIFNTSIIYKNGGIKTNLTDSGILEIIVPAPHMEHGNTALANMSIARLPKNVLEDVKGIKVITK